MRTIPLCIGVLAACVARAEPVMVNIPGKSWSLTFDIGLVSAYQAKRGQDSFQYMAMTGAVAGAPATTLSFFVEREGAESARQCRTTFWTRSLSNPLIARQSVTMTAFPEYEQVLYQLTTGQPNATFYFVHGGYCVDVHVSLSKALPSSDEVLTGYGRTLRWK